MKIVIVFVCAFVTMARALREGIDVSHHNGDIDWERVAAAGVQFAVAKATEGNHFRDDKFLDNWQGMRNNSISAGAYHYLRGGQSAESQVANINRVLGQCDFDVNSDVLAIDVEEKYNEDVSADQMADTLNGTLTSLSRTYKNITVYTGPYYWQNKLAWQKHNFQQYNLWIAHYTKHVAPTIPSPWESVGFTWWQYTDKGRVDGIQGDVDRDRTHSRFD